MSTHEVQTMPVETEHLFDAATRNELSAVRHTPDAVSPSSSFAFRLNDLFPDKSLLLSKSLDNITKEVALNQHRQEGSPYLADFEHVLARTRVLEAQIEGFKGQENLGGEDVQRWSSISPGKYLKLEGELERKIGEFMVDVSEVKKDMEELNKHAKDLTDGDITTQEDVTLAM